MDHILTLLSTAVVVVGYRESLVSVKEGNGPLSVIVSKNGTTSQQITLTVSTHTYSEILQSSSTDFIQSNTSDYIIATCRFIRIITVLYHYDVYVAGVDYKEKNMTFTMAPEQNDYVIQFEVFDDELQEKTESFFALLQLVDSSTLGAVIGRYIVQLTIVDNDGKNYESCTKTIVHSR